MKLMELTGIKHLKGKSAESILGYLELKRKDGETNLRIIGAGANGVALSLGDYVYKFWYADSGYETYMQYCLEHQGEEFIPTIHGGRIRELPLNFTPEDNRRVKFVKMDKLYEVTDSSTVELLNDEYLEGIDFDNVVPFEAVVGMYLEYAPMTIGEYEDFIYPVLVAAGDELSPEDEEEWINILDQTAPGDRWKLLSDEVNNFFTVLYNNTQLGGHNTYLDLHMGNIMMNSSGDIFILDPLANVDDMNLNKTIFKSLKDILEKKQS